MQWLLKSPERCSPIKPQCPATAVRQITNSDVTGPLKQWFCEQVGSEGVVVKVGSWEVQPPTSNTPEDSAGLHLMRFQKNPPPIQIRSPNLHVSSFPQCSLWWLCGAGGVQPRRMQWGGGGGGREGQEEMTALSQAEGRHDLFHVPCPCPTPSFFLIRITEKWGRLKGS